LVIKQRRLAPADQREKRRVAPLKLPVRPLEHRRIPALIALEPLDRLANRKIPERVVILPPAIRKSEYLPRLPRGRPTPDELLPLLWRRRRDRHFGHFP